MSPADPKRRSTAAHAAILEAAWQEVVDKGYERLTVEGIAARAGVGKQTLYRWWPSKAAVLLERFNSRVDPATMEFPDTGDIVADLGDQISQVAQFFSSESGATYRALLAASQSDPELADEILRQVIKPRSDACVQRLKKAQAEGQLRIDVDPWDIVELIYGPLYYRLVLRTRPMSAADARKQLRRIIEGLRPPT